MLKLFGGGKPDHPLGDPKEARKILDEVPANDPIKALEELGHWLDSVSTAEGFKPDQRAQLLIQVDDTAQVHIRKVSRDYLSSTRPSKFQEGRLWTAVHSYWQHCGRAFAASVEVYGSGAKGVDVLRNSVALLSARALRALAQQMKWAYLRYGPFDDSVWGIVARVYALAEEKKFAQQKVTVYPTVPGESSPEQEFLRAVMLAASSPDSLLPVEIELAERLVAHFSASFTLVLDQQPDIAYWIDLATSKPPLRLARPPQHAPTLRFFAAGKAMQELEELTKKVKTSNTVPSSLNLGGTYEPEMVLDVLNHLLLYWSTKPPERRHPRHRVKSRLAVAHGLEGVLGALGASDSLDFDATQAESWIVENVSAGGFGAVAPQIKGEWLKIGCLLAMQPEGGSNWVMGVVRRFNRDSPQQGSVGIQTIAKAMVTAPLDIGGTPVTGIILDPQGIESAPEARVILKPNVLVTGQNIDLELGGKQLMLMPQGVIDHGDDYELVRCRPMLRDTGE
jgi:hypothetical protein